MATLKVEKRGNGKNNNKAVQIVGIGKNGKLKFQKDVLEGILKQLPNNMHLAVLSIGGQYRTGKSFFLNYFRHFLLNQCPAAGGEIEKMSGFAWTSGAKGFTKGIWAWPNLFIVERPPGSKPFGLLLIDTEGSDDVTSEYKRSTLILGLSTLISSYQIINIRANIGQNDLGNLEIFTDIASRNQQLGGAYLCKPFQNLTVLVRDSIVDAPYGVASNEFMAEYGLSCTTAAAPASNLQIIDAAKCYRVTTGFLMPHPGKRIVKMNESPTGQQSSKDGKQDYKEDEREFLESMNQLVKLIMASIQVKAFDEREPLDPKFIIPLIEAFIDNENGNSEIKSHVQALGYIMKMNAFLHATKEYGEKIQKKWD